MSDFVLSGVEKAQEVTGDTLQGGAMFAKGAECNPQEWTVVDSMAADECSQWRSADGRSPGTNELRLRPDFGQLANDDLQGVACYAFNQRVCS